MNELLQAAIDALQIQDVCQRASLAVFHPEFEPKYDERTDHLNVEFMHVVARGQIMSFDEDGKQHQIFRVFIDLGARWIDPENISDEKEVNEEDVLAKVEATYIAEYLLNSDPGKEALDEFARKNASYHVWPYWREFLSGQCSRMNLPKVVLPTIQVAFNSKES